MNRLEDYLKIPETSNNIRDLIDSPQFKGSQLEKSLQELEDEVRLHLQNEIDKSLENSHEIDAIIDDGGISGNRTEIDYLVQAEEDEINRMIASSNRIANQEYDEEHYVDHEILGDSVGWDEDEFVQRQIEFHSR